MLSSKETKEKEKKRIKKDICSIEEFMELAVKYGYAYARRRFCNEKRKELLSFIIKNFSNIENFKALLKEKRISLSVSAIKNFF
jgi:transcription elongation GreA/GreB family factor